MKEWKTYKLGDLINIQSGGTPNKAVTAYWGGNIPWISAKTMYVDFITDSDTHITEDGLKKGSKLAPIGSILLLTRGSGLFNRIPVCLVKEPVAYNQDIKCITVKDCSITSNAFMFFWLYSQKELLSGILETTGIGAGKIDTCRLLDINVQLPDIQTQSKFIQFCSSILEKIEINKRINDNLEQQAQALYKSWFVDFEPFKDGNFVESELGLIPEGWEVGGIYKYVNVIYGAPYKSSLFNEDKEGYPLIRIRDLKSFAPQFYTTEILPQTEYIIAGDVVAGMDAEFTPYIWQGDKGVLNQRCCKFKGQYQWISNYYLLNLLKPELEYVQSYKTGTTVSHLGKADIDRFNVIIPPESVVKDFSSIVDALLKQKIKGANEIRSLTATRDSLLPKLISGELKINEIDS